MPVFTRFMYSPVFLSALDVCILGFVACTHVDQRTFYLMVHFNMILSCFKQT